MARKNAAPTAPKQPKQPKPPKPSKQRPAKATSTSTSGLVLAGVPRVNLLPPSELQQRTALLLVNRWLAGLVGTAIVVSGLVAGAHRIHALAADQLAAEENRTAALNLDLADLSHVSQTITERADLTRMRAEAMGNDTQWRALFKQVNDVAPIGAEITAFELMPGANPVEGVPPEAGIGAIGRFTLSTDDPADHNRMIDNLRRLDITLAADAGALTAATEDEDDDGFTFVVEFVFNQALYSGDHQAEAGER